MDIPSGPIPKGFDAANAPNHPDIVDGIDGSRSYVRLRWQIEKQFAVKCIEQAEAYWNLLGAISPKSLKLTRHDDAIFNSLAETFPELAANKDGCLAKLDEEAMKSKEGKEKWRKWIAQYEKTIKDYNFGTLVRTDANDDYTERNTTFTTRIQFYGIEIARNRLGLNDKAHEMSKKDKEEKESKSKAQA